MHLPNVFAWAAIRFYNNKTEQYASLYGHPYHRNGFGYRVVFQMEDRTVTGLGMSLNDALNQLVYKLGGPICANNGLNALEAHLGWNVRRSAICSSAKSAKQKLELFRKYKLNIEFP